MRVGYWGSAMLVMGVLASCGPTPPLEVVSEPGDFTAGITVDPVQPTPGPDPVVVGDGAPTPIVEPGVGPDPVAQPTGPTDDPVSGTNFDVVVEDTEGLTERLPNTCKLENYQQFVGQSAAVITSANLDRPWRIILPDTIVTQEYNPARLNFRADAQGVIQRITCG